MAKQTFTTGQVLTAAQMTSLQQTAMGGGSPSTKTASYVLVAADAGTVIQMNSASATTITVNTALFSAGDSVQIQNIGAGTCTITAGTATVNSAGSLGVTQYDGGFLYFSSASSAIWFDYTQAGTASPLTTKGDLYTRTSSADARLPVGTNGYTLVADSAEATGLKWAAPAGSTFAGVRANNSTTAQTIPNNTKTVLTFSAENFDTDAYHSTSTNTGRLTVPTGKAGYYRIYYSIQWNVNGTGRRAVDLFLNGTTTCICTGEITVSGTSYPSCNGSTTFYLSDGDYVNIAAYQTSGGNLDTNAGGFDHFGMEKIG